MKGEACPHCEKTGLRGREGLFGHIKQKHGLRKARAAVPDCQEALAWLKRDERSRAAQRREDSLADRAVNASIDRAMGLPVDEYDAYLLGDWLEQHYG